MGFYDRFILPPVIGCACGTQPMRYQRKKIVPDAQGVVLDIGCGTGHNFGFLNPKRVRKIYALEPARGMIKRAQKTAKASGLQAEFLITGAENIPLKDKSVDSVLLTYTLCTIPEPERALAEIKRVMKPNAKLLFSEHGLAKDATIRARQNRYNGIWKRIAGGCNMNRDIPKLLRSAKLKIAALDEMFLPSTPKILGYNYWGCATK